MNSSLYTHCFDYSAGLLYFLEKDSFLYMLLHVVSSGLYPINTKKIKIGNLAKTFSFDKKTSMISILALIH